MLLLQPAEPLTLEQQLSRFPLFAQLPAQAQAQLLGDLQKQQRALQQGVRLVTLPPLASPGTAASGPPDSQSQTTASIGIGSVRIQEVRNKEPFMRRRTSISPLPQLPLHFMTWIMFSFRKISAAFLKAECVVWVLFMFSQPEDIGWRTETQLAEL